MSSRTLGVAKRFSAVVGIITYAILATRTVAYVVINDKTTRPANMDNVSAVSWWNISDGNFTNWMLYVIIAAMATVILAFVSVGVWYAIRETWRWIVSPRPSEIAADARKKDETAAAEAEKARKRNLAPNGEPINVPDDEESASGGFEQPPVDVDTGLPLAFIHGVFLKD